MRVTMGLVNLMSNITVDSDIDMLTLYQVKNLAAPASGEVLRKGNKDIANAEVADAAAIVRSKLNFGDGLVNADIAAAAAIALSKLASLPLTLTVAETEVFSGNSPTSWTDLDLSAVVGENSAFVILKVINTAVQSSVVAFRKKGDTDEYYFATPTDSGAGAALTDCEQNIALILIVPTDTGGFVQWTSEAAVAFTIDIIAYLK